MFTSAFLIPLRVTVFTLLTIFALVLDTIELGLLLGFEVETIEDTDALDTFGFEHAEHSEWVG